MFACRIENGKGEILTLTNMETNYQVIQIDGLNPPKATINLTNIAGMDGSRFNSAKLESRNIVIYLKLNNNVEENRILLYKYFATKEWCKFYYKNAHRDVYVECYVQTVEVTPFTDKEIMQISLLCPQPYFKDMEVVITDISKVVASFKFPFYINNGVNIPISTYDASRVTIVRNDSESSVGVNVEIIVKDDINKIHIRNTVTGESMIINDSNGFSSGDIITINTNRGEKSVRLIRNGATTNLFSKLQSGFSFFQLAMGVNRFSYQIDDGVNDEKVDVIFNHRPLYRGA